jgi:flagella basal body P-ring formation protein FlgA
MRKSWSGSRLLPVFAVAGALVLCAALAASRAMAAGAATKPQVQARQRVEGAALQAEAVRAISAWMAQQPVSRFEVSAGLPMTDVDVPAGPWSLSARPLAPGQVPVGRIIVWVDVQVVDRLERRVPVVVTVRSFAPRWQARTDLPARAAIGSDLFERQEIELSLPSAAAPVELPAGKRLSRSMVAGQVLQPAHIEQATEVTRGDMVEAHVRRGLVSVQTRGEALQDGRSGQRIQVRIAGASGPVLAQVVGPGTVQVNE